MACDFVVFRGKVGTILSACCANNKLVKLGTNLLTLFIVKQGTSGRKSRKETFDAR